MYIEDFIFAFIVGVFLIGSVVLIFLGITNTNDLNTWTSKCNDIGGVTSRVRAGFVSDRYECFVDGKIVTIPGYEGK